MEIIDAFRSGFCVYGHFCDGDIIYVGSGSVSRPLSKRRSTLWEKIVAGRPVTVMIFDWFETRSEALIAEFAMIALLDPPANIVKKNYLVAGVTLGKLDVNLRCVQTRQVFTQISDIVDMLGVPHNTVLRYLRGESKSAGGYTFKQTKKDATIFPAKALRPKRLRWPVRCIETGEIFYGSIAVFQKLRIDRKAVIAVIEGKKTRAGRYSFENAPREDQKMTDPFMTPPRSKRAKRIAD